MGTVTLELVLATPVLFLVLVLIVFAGRAVSARSDVVSAASDGARAASIERSSVAARLAAQDAVEATLSAEGVGCRGEATPTVRFIDGETGGAAAFEPGNYVEVRVTCDVNLSDLSGLGLPGAMSSSGRALEMIDEHRGAG